MPERWIVTTDIPHRIPYHLLPRFGCLLLSNHVPGDRYGLCDRTLIEHTVTARDEAEACRKGANLALLLMLADGEEKENRRG